MAGSGWGVPSIGLGTTFTQLGRAAKDISSTLESGLQNVAENLEGAFVTLGEGTAERAGCVTRTSSFSSLDRDLSPAPGQDNNKTSSPQGCFGFEGSERERLFETQQVEQLQSPAAAKTFTIRVEAGMEGQGQCF